MTTSINDARSVLHHQCHDLLHRSNVVATGIGYKISEDTKTSELSLICSVSKKLAVAELSPRDVIPKSFDGISTDVVASGLIRAFEPQTQRLRPALGGLSIGHTDITAGTLGCLVRRGNDIYILSNNHVMANSNEASLGDPIIQPGPIDGGNDPTDRIATLAEFIPITFPAGGDNDAGDSTCPLATGLASGLNTVATIIGSKARMQAISTRAVENLVDAAIAGPVDPTVVSNDILGIGEIQGTREGDLGLEVQKSGRTTGYTTGQIEQIDVTVNVQFGGNRVGTFSDQLICSDMSRGGDSGSAVLDMDRNLVGLLFAGSDTMTIVNRIQNVFNALNITL